MPSADSAVDFDRDGIKFVAESSTGETAAAIDGIENGQTPSIITSPELEGENVIKIELI